MVIVLNPISAEKVSSIWSSKQNTRGGGVNEDGRAAQILMHMKERERKIVFIFP